EMMAIEVYRNNKLVIRAAAEPYSCTQKSEVYSLSKTFTSTGVGFAVEEGLLRLTDSVISYFDSELPTTISENLAAMQVHHLLCMSTGHDDCVMPEIVQDNRGIRAFFEHELKYRPGTHFAYNTAASFLLSAIVTKVTGQTLLDYLTPRLFTPLGSYGISWDSAFGYNLGGTGLNISCDDIAQFGLLYLNKGMYHGRQLLPLGWAEQMSTVYSDTSADTSPDWSVGYGYQCWRNSRGGYRGDGAYGQACIVLPERQTVVALRGYCALMQPELDYLFELLDKLSPVPDGASSCGAIAPYLPLKKAAHALLPFENSSFLCAPNELGVTAVAVRRDGERLVLTLSDGAHPIVITAGNGEWVANVFYAGGMKPKLTHLLVAGY
ncbi:MAG: serine hydrolase, partial [Angelakisella sp.]